MQEKARNEFWDALGWSLLLATPVVLLAWAQMLTALWPAAVLTLILILLPPYANGRGASMLKGLFDLDLSPNYGMPVRLFFVTLAAYSVAATAYVTTRLMVLTWWARIGVGEDSPQLPPWLNACFHPTASPMGMIAVLVALNGLAIYFAAWAIGISYAQDKSRTLGRMIGGLLAALLAANAMAAAMIVAGLGAARLIAGWVEASAAGRWLVQGPGYAGGLLVFHIEAGMAAVATLALYVGLGIFGRRALGRRTTVAAVIGPLMAAMVFGWTSSWAIFLLGEWHLPLLVPVVVVAVLAKYFHGADHTYEMVSRADAMLPDAYTVLRARARRCAIVVAAEGGGIQAAAWTAQVLQGLQEDEKSPFADALCALSGISGGSVGSAMYLNWLADPLKAIEPVTAASDSSLDEVAWGLAWPDLLRLGVPGLVGNRMDRALAMEQAWLGNSRKDHEPGRSALGGALSNWNEKVARGDLPALLMGSTMVESGNPLILGTSRIGGASRMFGGWMEGGELHVSRGAKLDIPVVRGARLSASFPYVSPAARPRDADLQPHMVDGGLFDNYGTATLTEWLDDALETQHARGETDSGVNRILLIQTQGFPSDGAQTLPKRERSHEGWLFQLIAPLKTLMNVRTAGQGSHRGIELELLKDKWLARGVEIEVATFVFNQGGAPLSWHLMPEQKTAIGEAWRGRFDDPQRGVCVLAERVKVHNFLIGGSPPPPGRGVESRSRATRES